MGHAEEYRARKKNKAAPKRVHKNVVDFTRGVQAAKRRRQAGRRRICEGMCYSLPTPEDPFNDLHLEKLAMRKARVRKNTYTPNVLDKPEVSHFLSAPKEAHQNRADGQRNSSSIRTNIKHKTSKREPIECAEHGIAAGAADSLTKHLTNNLESDKRCSANIGQERLVWTPVTKVQSTFEMCLFMFFDAGLIENPELFMAPPTKERQNVLFSICDWPFLEACGTGMDVLVTRGTVNQMQEINHILAVAAHITIKKLVRNSYRNPAVLFLSSSQEGTLKMRKLCRPFKTSFGIRSVSLHAGTSLDRQIEGLSEHVPEVLIATPDRLLDLLDLKTISLSDVSFMVVDKLGELLDFGFEEQIRKISALVDTNVQILILCERLSHTAVRLCQQVLRDPITRVSSCASLVECSMCISQDVSVLISQDKKLQKLLLLVRQHFEVPKIEKIFKGVAVFVCQCQTLLHLKAVLKAEGYSVGSVGGNPMEREQATLTLQQFREGLLEVLVFTKEFLSQIEISKWGTIIVYDFPSSMSVYSDILTRMARHTVKGMLHSFCTGAAAPLASQLMEMLQQCFQPIPQSLVMLADAAKFIVK